MDNGIRPGQGYPYRQVEKDMTGTDLAGRSRDGVRIFHFEESEGIDEVS